MLLYLIGLPRGKFGDLEGALRAANVPFSTQDLRACGTPVKVGFQGELYPIQKEAADAILWHDNGILCAATAFGKTAVGAYLVAHREVSTLILVHNREILKNWIEDFHKFLRIDEEAPTYLTGSGRERKRKSPVGKLYAAHDSMTGIIDVAMVSSLKEDDPRLDSYGLVIMDECHHAAAANTERIIQKIKAKYIYGLTATPKRDDGMEQKVYMQFGGILYRFTARQLHCTIPSCAKAYTCPRRRICMSI